MVFVKFYIIAAIYSTSGFCFWGGPDELGWGDLALDLKWLVSEILLKSLVMGTIWSIGPFYYGVSSSVAFLEFWML
jgi:hypothetical protein